MTPQSKLQSRPGAECEKPVDVLQGCLLTVDRFDLTRLVGHRSARSQGTLIPIVPLGATQSLGARQEKYKATSRRARHVSLRRWHNPRVYGIVPRFRVQPPWRLRFGAFAV